MGVSKNRGTLKSSRVFHYKPSILGYPYFWKHPYNLFSIIFGRKDEMETEVVVCWFSHWRSLQNMRSSWFVISEDHPKSKMPGCTKNHALKTIRGLTRIRHIFHGRCTKLHLTPSAGPYNQSILPFFLWQRWKIWMLKQRYGDKDRCVKLEASC